MTRTQWPKYAFIDEYGNAGLNLERPNVSGYFIVTSILVEGSELDALRAAAEVVRSRYFQLHMKSQHVKDDGRRIKVLRDLCDLPFRFFAVAIDKSALSKEGGLIYRQSFYKFLQNILYEKLYGAVPALQVIADRYGDEPFMESFQAYLHKRYSGDLFPPQIEFRASTDDVMLQVADFVAGTLGRCLDPTKRSDRANEFFELLEPRAIEVLSWPPNYHYKLDRESATTADDVEVRRLARDGAFNYICDRAGSADEDERARVATLEYLIHYTQFKPSHDGYVATDVLREALEKHGLHLSQQQFRSRVVGALRDREVLIASSAKGYKLPECVGDLQDFCDRVSQVAEPYLRRLQKAQRQVRLATLNRVDLLHGGRYETLRRLVGALSDARVE